MLGNKWGNWLGISTFGESHGRAMGILLEDIKPGLEFPLDEIREALTRRRPGKSEFSTSRIEPDDLEVISGVFEGKTTGMPICLLIRNSQQRSRDYSQLKDIFRPGHADFSYFKKFKIYDYRGGGRASGRETVARVVAGELVDHLLGDIKFLTYPIMIAGISATSFQPDFANLLHWPDPDTYQSVQNRLSELKAEGDSAGGIIEMKIDNIPAGLGDPVFEKLDANLAKAIISIGSVKGIEFGRGFKLANLSGSEANDEMKDENFLTNNSGGILGGISNGNQIVLRFVVKPTPSISKPQQTIDKDENNQTISVTGRHDTCIVPRLIPAAEAMAKLVLADAISYQKLVAGKKRDLNDLREGIDKIDEDILIALARRMKISQHIGVVKKQSDKQVTDPNREKDLYGSLKQKAKFWGLNPDLIQQIWPHIIAESKNQQ